MTEKAKPSADNPSSKEIFDKVVAGKTGIENPYTVAFLTLFVFAAIVHSMSGADVLPSFVVGLPYAVAAAVSVYIWRRHPTLLRDVTPKSAAMTRYQSVQFFSIVFLLGVSLFGNDIISSQLLEQIFGSVRFYIGFLVLGVGIAGVLLGQLTTLIYLQSLQDQKRVIRAPLEVVEHGQEEAVNQ